VKVFFACLRGGTRKEKRQMVEEELTEGVVNNRSLEHRLMRLELSIDCLINNEKEFMRILSEHKTAIEYLLSKRQAQVN